MGVKELALSAMAPPEKNEHFIYVIFPFSFGIWLVTLIQPSNPVDAIGLVVVAASFWVLLLYETTPDEYIVKAFYRWRQRNRLFSQKEAHNHAFLAWGFLMRAWETELSEVKWDADYLQNQLNKTTEVVVSSPYVGQRLRRIRSSVYLFLAIPFIIHSSRNSLDIAWIAYPTEFSNLPLYLRNSIEFFIQGWIIHPIIQVWILVFLAFWALQVIVHLRRHKHLVSYIMYLIWFRHLQRLIAIDQIKRPREYRIKEGERMDGTGRLVDIRGRSKQPLVMIREELTVLQDILSERNWSVFIDRWARIFETIRNEIIRDVSNYAVFYLVEPWAELVLHHNKTIYPEPGRSFKITEAERQLGWIIYYVNQAVKNPDDKTRKARKKKQVSKPDEVTRQSFVKLDEKTKSLFRWVMETYKQDPKEFRKPETLLMHFDEFIMPNLASRGLLWAIGYAVNSKLPYNASIENGLRALVDELTSKKETLLDKAEVAEVLLRAHSSPDSVGFSCHFIKVNQLNDIHSKVDPTDRRWLNLILNFINRAGENELAQALGTESVTSSLGGKDIRAAVLEREKQSPSGSLIRQAVLELRKKKIIV